MNETASTTTRPRKAGRIIATAAIAAGAATASAPAVAGVVHAPATVTHHPGAFLYRGSGNNGQGTTAFLYRGSGNSIEWGGALADGAQPAFLYRG